MNGNIIQLLRFCENIQINTIPKHIPKNIITFIKFCMNDC